MGIESQSSWQLMMATALLLGIRHGFDLDHLATIDALARAMRHERRIASLAGFLFSMGHGIVVTGASLLIGGSLIQSTIPEWMEGVGNWISIFFLVLFGILNLRNVFQKNPASDLPGGVKSFLTKRVAKKKLHPLLILVIGALFAFSFDTFTQIALFSLSASLVSGYLFAGALGIAFTLGMILSDGLNGLLIALLIQRADRTSLILSRSLGFTVALFSLIIGGMGIFNMVS